MVLVSFRGCSPCRDYYGELMQTDWAEMEHLSSEISQKSFLVRAIIEMMIRKYYEDVKVLKVVKFYCHSAARWSVKVLSRGKQPAAL